MSKINPLGEYVVAVQNKKKSTTASGLYLPESAQTKQQTGIVIAVGKDVSSLKEADHIIYKSFNTVEVKFEDSEYLLIKEEDVLATINEEKN